MSKLFDQHDNHSDENQGSHNHGHNHSGPAEHGHGHSHRSDGQDPFLNPSKFFMWKYSFRNYIKRRSYYKELIKQLNLQGEETVLDFGSGTGSLAKRISSKVKNGELYCLDVSSKLLDYTKNQLKKKENVKFLLGDLKSLSLPEKSFDYIVSTWVLHHLEKDDLTSTIEEFSRILKDTGKIFIIEFPEGYEHNHRVHSLISPSVILGIFKDYKFSNKTLLSKQGGTLYELHR